MEELIAKYLANELSGKERADFEAELIQNQALADELEVYAAVMDIASDQASTFNSQKAWNNVDQRISKTKVVEMKRPTYNWLKVAAAFLVFAVAGFLAYNSSQKKSSTDEELTLATESNGIREFQLADGSVVKLNANSKITLAEGFGEDNRSLTLEGEANFDVSRNESLPFVINAGNSQVKVLGTSFNLTTYPDEDIELNVTEGTVEFSSTVNGDVKEQITKGEMAKMDRGGRSILKASIKNANFSGWWTRRLEFDNTPLPEALDYIEDTYWVKFEYNKETFKNCPLNGIYEHKSVSEIIEAIDATFPNIQFIQKENHIKLEGKPCTE